MRYGIVKGSLCTIYEKASETMTSDGQVLSAIADEVMHGMIVAITGDAESEKYAEAKPAVSAGVGHTAGMQSGQPAASAAGQMSEAAGNISENSPAAMFLPVRTFYNYTGYLPVKDVLEAPLETVKEWEASDLRVVNGICVDVTSLPKVQGVKLISLFRGSLVKVLDWESEQEGWARVELADGRVGYMRNQYLSEKKFSQAGAWLDGPVQAQIADEGAFRRAVAETAKSYLGVQYRWGGKTTAGIDCSGLVSVSYMQNGILIYRDARIMDGFPLRRISREEMKMGDLLFFPGHVAMYLGDGLYIHSTGRIGSGGVVFNSLDPNSPIYRQDLVESMSAVGSIFG